MLNRRACIIGAILTFLGIKYTFAHNTFKFTEGLGAPVHGYVDRGDPAAVDFDQDDLTLDGNWHDLDLSAIVPFGAKAVNLHMDVSDTHRGHGLELRKNGNVNEAVHLVCLAPINNSDSHCISVIACDRSRRLEYRVVTSADSAIITVNGWWM